MAYVQKSMYKEGIVEIEKGLAISPGNTTALAVLGYDYALEGKRAEAQKVLDQIEPSSQSKTMLRTDGRCRNLWGSWGEGQGIRVVGKGL